MTEAANHPTSNHAIQQSWTASGYDKNARFVSELGAEILSWLDVKQGERILDLGCGDGALTEKIAGVGAIVTGVDMSAEFIEAAKQRGLDVRYADGNALPFDGEFDAVFSNAALHWMTKPEEVLAGVARALKPGGRFIAEFGGHGNMAAVITAMRSAALAFNGDVSLAHPWFFPTPDEYGAMLKATGFIVDRIELVPRQTPLPTGMEGWLFTFRKPFFEQFENDKGAAALAHALELLRPSLCDTSGRWIADYVRLRVAARLSNFKG